MTKKIKVLLFINLLEIQQGIYKVCNIKIIDTLSMANNCFFFYVGTYVFKFRSITITTTIR